MRRRVREYERRDLDPFWQSVWRSVAVGVLVAASITGAVVGLILLNRVLDRSSGDNAGPAPRCTSGSASYHDQEDVNGDKTVTIVTCADGKIIVVDSGSIKR